MNTHSSVAQPSAENSQTAPMDAPKVATTVKPLAQPPAVEAADAPAMAPNATPTESTPVEQKSAGQEPAAQEIKDKLKVNEAEAAKVEGFSSSTPAQPASQDSLNTKTLKQIFQLSPIGMTILDL
ncbi:MAG: hypothetical protein AAGL17_22455, partial [Cyanobacteria bacterium J06576_12]